MDDQISPQGRPTRHDIDMGSEYYKEEHLLPMNKYIEDCEFVPVHPYMQDYVNMWAGRWWHWYYAWWYLWSSRLNFSQGAPKSSEEEIGQAVYYKGLA